MTRDIKILPLLFFPEKKTKRCKRRKALNNMKIVVIQNGILVMSGFILQNVALVILCNFLLEYLFLVYRGKTSVIKCLEDSHKNLTFL